MKKIGSFLLVHKAYGYVIIALVAFFAARVILLQKPNTELTYTVKRENLVDTVDVSGFYTTASQIQVTSPNSGVIDQLFVVNAQQVKKGDALFHVQSTATEDQAKAAYAAYLTAISTLKADTAQLYTLQSTMYSKWKIYTDLATNSTYQNSDSTPNTANRILTEFSTAQDNWFAAEQNYKNQQAVIDKDNASVVSAKLTYDETQSVTVKAPIAGTIVNLHQQIGDQVSGPSPVTLVPGPAVLIIADLSHHYISAEVSEDYALRIVPDQPVTIVFDALKDKQFIGHVIAIDTVGSGTQGAVTYTARVSLEDGLANLKPGMSAVVSIETFRKDQVIDVPNSAIVRKDGQTFVQQAGSHKLVPVSPGEKGLTKTEITNGLSEGTVVVASPVL